MGLGRVRRCMHADKLTKDDDETVCQADGCYNGRRSDGLEVSNPAKHHCEG